jgi:hypothetical protein
MAALPNRVEQASVYPHGTVNRLILQRIDMLYWNRAEGKADFVLSASRRGSSAAESGIRQ